ncbi:MAG TPA: hypothetical protein VJB13_00900 [Candidatus Nanoarchaeia archaeon]|nr:hypothetical protein [Candidatus Nanoarchaeia archaeon]
MVERNVVIDRLKMSYEGLFNLDELHNLISSYFYEKGYDWYEKMNQVIVTPSGKQVRIILEPWKNITDYYKLIVAIKINVIDLKEVDVKVGNETIKTNQGTLRMIIDGYVLSDRKSKWSHKPLYWFMSIVFEKYFFKEHYAKAETWIKSDVETLHSKIKTYLNTFTHAYGR